MSAEQPPEKWSLVSAEQRAAYLDEAQRVVGFCHNNKISIFGAALAGVSLIRLVLTTTMGGDLRWWQKMIDPGSDFEELFGLGRQKRGC